MNGTSLKWSGLWIVVLSAALAGSAEAQGLCENSPTVQAVAVRLKNYTGDSDTVKLGGRFLKPGIGPKPGDQETVFGLPLGDRVFLSSFQNAKPEVPCRRPVFRDGPRPEPYAGKCWAVLTYDVREETCWHLKVVGQPITPPFRVFIGQKALPARTKGNVGWNVEHDLPRMEYVQVGILPPTEKAAKEQALLFETDELGPDDVPKTLDCKAIFDRIVQSQLACQPSCASHDVDQYLVPYLGDPPGSERGKTESPLGVAAAARAILSDARAEWLKKAETAWNGQCRLPLTSLTFESAR